MTDARIDVLIAGGGIAGTALAIGLGRAGYRVQLFDKATFPREKPCGEGVMPLGVELLRRLGVNVPGAPFYGIRYHSGTQIAAGHFPKINGKIQIGHGFRRYILDAHLIQLATHTPSVEACSGVAVEGPIIENGQVVGLQVNGEALRAKLVVAADGLHSRLRRQLGLEGKRPKRWRVGVRAHFRLNHPPPAWVDVFLGRGYELYTTPLPCNELLVAGLAQQALFETGREENFHQWIAEQPILADRLAGATQITKLMGSSPLSQTPASRFCEGAVLLGDAAGFIDPITGGGITQALLTADLLCRYISNYGLTSTDWLKTYDRQRAGLLRDYQLLTRALLWLSDKPQVAHGVLMTMRYTPTLMRYLIGVAGGVRRISPMPKYRAWLT